MIRYLTVPVGRPLARSGRRKMLGGNRRVPPGYPGQRHTGPKEVLPVCVLQGCATQVSTPSRSYACRIGSQENHSSATNHARALTLGPLRTCWNTGAVAGHDEDRHCYASPRLLLHSYSCQIFAPIPRVTRGVPGFNLLANVPHAREIDPGPSERTGTMRRFGSPAVILVITNTHNI